MLTFYLKRVMFFLELKDVSQPSSARGTYPRVTLPNPIDYMTQI